jgi:VWFA-related protein
MRRILTSLLVAGAGAAYQAQAPQSSSVQDTFRTGVELVRLDVSVLDQDRRPIRGLTAQDFTILEDGKPQPIAAFSAIDIPDAAAPAAGWMHDVGSDVVTNQLDVRRVVVILMDDGNTSVDDGAPKTARQIARAVIDRLGPNDLAAVVFTFQGKSQNFTTDRRQLIAAVESFVPKGTAAPGKWSVTPNPLGAQALAGPLLGCQIPGFPNCLTRTLTSVASALEDTPAGRKTIALISSGVPYNFSMENLNLANDVDDLQQTFHNLQRANVNVYPFDPRGLTADGIISERIDSLRIFADHTGGRATVATNTPWEQVPQMFAENSSYYLLGIRPSDNGKPDAFRRIAVKVARPDAEVRARAGYYPAIRKARSRTSKSAPPLTGLDQAFGAALPSGTLPLEVSVVPLAAGDGRQGVVLVTTSVRRPVTETISTERLAVRTAAVDISSAKELASHRQTGELTLRPHAIGERRFELQSRLTVRPGRYEIRVGAEVSGSAGGVFTPVEVPDFSKARLSLSGLVLGLRRSVQDDGLAGLLPVVPTAAREFTASAPVTAFLRVYQGGRSAPVPVEIRLRTVDTSMRTVAEESAHLEPARFQSGRSADCQFELPLSRLAQGEYLLTVEASAAKTSVRREVRFRVATSER